MAALLPILPYAGEILGGAAVLTYAITKAIRGDGSDGYKKQISALEKQRNELANLVRESNQGRAEADARFHAVQEALLAGQARNEELMKKEKEEIRNSQIERERLIEQKNQQFVRFQKEMIDAEKEHQQKLAEEERGGLKRSHDEFERQMALGRERLAKEDEFLKNVRREHELCLEEERERFKESQANYERHMGEDRQRMAQEMKTFSEAQKKWDDDRVVLKQNYDKLQSNLNEGYQQLRRDQRELEERLQTKMNDLMDEQKNLTVLEKEQKLKDLTETYLSYCEMYGNDPENLTTETKEFQRKYKLQLTKVKNSLQVGDNFLTKLEIWAKGAMLDMRMLTLLSHNNKVKPEALRASGQQYQREMATLMANFNASNALPTSVDEGRAIQNSFLYEVESHINRALPASASPLLALQAPAAPSRNSNSPACTESAATGGGVSTVPVQRPDQQLPGDASWSRCDALVQSLRESSFQDQTQISTGTKSTRSGAVTQSLGQSVLDDHPHYLGTGSANSTRSDALAQLLRESVFEDLPQLSVSANSTRSNALAQTLRESVSEDQSLVSGSAKLNIPE